MPNLGDKSPPDNIRIFTELCWARARLWAAGEIRGPHGAWIGYAVDPLQAWAAERGLVKEIGQDEVQRIMGEAFAEVRKDGDPDAL